MRAASHARRCAKHATKRTRLSSNSSSSTARELRTRQARGLRTYAIMDLVYPAPELAAGKERKPSEKQRHPTHQQALVHDTDMARDNDTARPKDMAQGKDTARQPESSSWRIGVADPETKTKSAFARAGDAATNPISSQRLASTAFERSMRRATDPRYRDEPGWPGILQRRPNEAIPAPFGDGFGRPLKEFASNEPKRRDDAPAIKPVRKPTAETTDAVAAKEPSEKAREMNARENDKDRKEVQEMFASWTRASRGRSRGGRD